MFAAISWVHLKIGLHLRQLSIPELWQQQSEHPKIAWMNRSSSAFQSQYQQQRKASFSEAKKQVNPTRLGQLNLPLWIGIRDALPLLYCKTALAGTLVASSLAITIFGEKVPLDTQKMEAATSISNTTRRGSHVQCIAPADDDTAGFGFLWSRDAMI